MLKAYLDQRILFYTTVNAPQLEEINASPTRLKRDLWSVIQAVAVANPTPVTSLAVSGVNDVLNAQRSAQAAWSTRIPAAAWALLEILAVLSNLLFGYLSLSSRITAKRFVVLPLIVSISFFFIADMDNPRDGFIPILPQNLMSLSASVQAQ